MRESWTTAPKEAGDDARGSTGVTGFALTAMCIGADRGWISRAKAKDKSSGAALRS